LQPRQWRWERLFGDRFAGLFVFAYQVVGDRAPLPADQLFAFRDNLYGFIGIRVADYARCSRQLSAKWDTVTVPTARFRELAAPIDWLFDQGVEPFAADSASVACFEDEPIERSEHAIAAEFLATITKEK
jgi:hypothetical protein